MTDLGSQVHVVQFDANGKISQIRLHWDQGTMLKQVEAIGKTGRNWPIRDGNMQTKMVKESVKSSGQAQASQGAPSKSTNGQAKPVESSNGNMDESFNTRLFATGQDQEPRRPSQDPGVSVRTSAKPEARGWDDHSFSQSQQVSQNARAPMSPSLKTGTGTHFERNRLFDQDEPKRQKSPEGRKADPTKFNHFEFGNGEDAPRAATDKPIPTKAAAKQTSNWGFGDFNTPEKVAPRENREQERHFGYGIDEVR